jgi:imidazolonepropionase-like amidohydrolase
MSTSSAYTREEIRAAVEEAERAGTYAAAHAHGGAGLRLAVQEVCRPSSTPRWPTTRTSRA